MNKYLVRYWGSGDSIKVEIPCDDLVVVAEKVRKINSEPGAPIINIVEIVQTEKLISGRGLELLVEETEEFKKLVARAKLLDSKGTTLFHLLSEYHSIASSLNTLAEKYNLSQYWVINSQPSYLCSRLVWQMTGAQEQ